MLIISIDYTAPLDHIDRALAQHRRWLDQHYESGLFLASGPKEPRTGGIVLAAGTTRDALERIVAEDPFHTGSLATHTITEFHPSRLAGALSHAAGRVALG